VAKRMTKKRAPARRVRVKAKKRAVKKTPAKSATRKTARRKVAARATATRQARKKPVPKKPSALASAAAAVKGALAGAVAIVTKRLPGDPDAIALLEADHRRLEDLLKRGEETTERAVKGRSELLRTITSELNAHELIEEKILYPVLQAHPEARDIVLEGFQEHHVADVVLKELHEVALNNEQWGAKFKVLKENIEHHIQEEEGPMFRTARGVLSRAELQRMGAQMRQMKAQAT
jgi:hemerythrin-like domain-containing protein